MIAAFVAGLAAGYGIAVPVGAVAILIVETGIRSGFRLAAAAGAGTAAADGIYATIAATFGAALAGVLAPWQAPLRVAAVVVLVGLSLRGFRAVARDAGRGGGRTSSIAAMPVEPSAVNAPGPIEPRADAPGVAADAELRGDAAGAVPGVAADAVPRGDAAGADAPSAAHRSARRVFAAFLGLTLLNPMTITYFAALILGLNGTATDPAAKVAFVAGAFGASLSWQTLVAAAGGALHRRIAPRLRLAVGVIGNVIVLGFAGVIAAGLAR